MVLWFCDLCLEDHYLEVKLISFLILFFLSFSFHDVQRADGPQAVVLLPTREVKVFLFFFWTGSKVPNFFRWLLTALQTRFNCINKLHQQTILDRVSVTFRWTNPIIASLSLSLSLSLSFLLFFSLSLSFSLALFSLSLSFFLALFSLSLSLFLSCSFSLFPSPSLLFPFPFLFLLALFLHSSLTRLVSSPRNFSFLLPLSWQFKVLMSFKNWPR